MDSILISIKKLLGIEENYTHFDTDIIMHINSVLSILTQLGVGPSNGYSIKDANAVWDEFISDSTRLELVKTYVYLKVRLMFDPPSSSSAIDSMKQLINELEFRITIATEST